MQTRPRLRAPSRACRRPQRTDGGWSQLPALESDAYATGLALFALHEARIPATHPTYRAGVKSTCCRLKPRTARGTSRRARWPFQPYFESGYPYGSDQWISAAAAAYATMALSAAVEPAQLAGGAESRFK
jgi:hypothetical protein